MNASSTSLRLGGGVSGAISRALGPSRAAELQRAMSAHAPIEPGHVVTTPSFGLAASWILHAASASGDAQAVRASYARAIEIAGQRGWSLAVPALGTGTGRLSVDRCASELAAALLDAARARRLPPALHVVVDDVHAFTAFRDALSRAAAELD